MMKVLEMALLAVLAADPGTAVFEGEGVRLEVAVESHIYEWTLTNLGDSPVTSFEVGQYHMYNHTAPDGWQIDAQDDVFRAWTDDPGAAIRPRQTGTFQARVSSAGAVLGEVDAIIGFSEGGDVRVEHVWSAVPEPIGKVAAIVGTIIAVALLHVWLVRRRLKRTAA